jgi:lysophospholipase L1-like esterase
MLAKHRKLSLIGGLSSSALLTGELAARFVLGLGTPPLSIEHPRIEYMFKPNQDVSRFGNRILINEYGMRSESFPPQRLDSSEIRIMVFGDSVINGGSLTDHSDLATTLVAKELAQTKNTKMIVGNISAGSWGPGNWLAYAEEYGFFDADIVTLLLSSHDYADNPSFASLNSNTHPVRRPTSALTEALSRYLPTYWNKWSNGRNKNYDKSQTVTQTVNPEDIKQGLQDLAAFLSLAKTKAQTVIVFLHLEKEELELNQIKDGHYEIVKLCDQLGIPAISLEPFYREPINHGVDIYRDNIHINEAGQQVLADAILLSSKRLILHNKNLATDE